MSVLFDERAALAARGDSGWQPALREARLWPSPQAEAPAAPTPHPMILKKFYLRCDRCGAHGPDAPTPELAVAAARELGWREPRAEGRRLDLCPVCTSAPAAQARADPAP